MSIDNFVCALEEYQEQKLAVENEIPETDGFPTPELEKLWKVEIRLSKAFREAVKDCIS